MKKIVFQILFIFGLIITTFSQSPTIIKHFSIEDGLSQNSINTLLQTSDGIIWIGTQDGLNEYDGYSFTVFKNNPDDSNSISNNFINDIKEDDKGNLILATKEGITIWERRSNKFIWLQHNPNDSNSISNNNILRILYFKNTIWALTINSLEKYEGNNTFKHYFFDADSVSASRTITFSNLIADSDDNIWFSVSNSLNVFYTKSCQFYEIKGDIEKISDKNIRNIFIDDRDNVWVGSYMGLNKYLKNSCKYLNYYYKQKSFSKENTITNILIDSQHNFWLGTKNGIKIFDGNNIIDVPNSSINNIAGYVTKLLIDKSNNMWVGTFGKGLYKFSLNKNKFDSFTNFFNTSDKEIFGLYAFKNKIWAGSGGYYVINKNTKQILHHDNFNSDSVHDVTTYSFFEDNGNIWVNTDYCIFIVDTSNYNTQTIFEYFNIPNNDIFKNNSVKNINKDKYGNYWISSNKGLIKFNGHNFITYKNDPQDSNSISYNIVVKTLIDGDSIWITTLNGLNLFNIKENKFKHWFKKDGLPNNYLFDLYKADKNTLWLSTSAGLAKLDIKRDSFTTFTSYNTGFFNDFFYTITSNPGNDDIWLTSNYGVVKFNTKNYNYITYDKTNGLSFLECNVNASYTDSNTIFFGGINGISWTNLNDSDFVEIPEKVIVNKIIYSNKNISSSNIFFPDTNELYIFDYNTVINIYFSLPDYTYTAKNKFKYKIEGLNETWSESQTVNFINITGLSPGKYTLYIKGANSSGVWNSSPTKIIFEIKPPWSRSTLAIIIYILIAIFFIFIGIWYVYKNFKKENLILQEKNFALEQVETQRKLLEDKNKNTTDSINYAKKIIEAILPPIENLNSILPDSFIYFLPKDIVSGDFYWFTEKANKIYIAAVDCTGHGIPGAFMSIIGMNLLDRLVNEGVNDPAVILNIMNKEVISTLKKKIDEKHMKDGMDMSLCVIDKKLKKLSFAGAYNPAYIIRDNTIIQLRGDRKSVGNDFDLDSFTTQDFKLHPDDIIYLFSDGYTDQFGSPYGKKFKFKRFRYFLLSICNLPLEQQKEKLHSNFIEWKMDYEQIDDILIIGFKPLSFLTP